MKEMGSCETCGQKAWVSPPPLRGWTCSACKKQAEIVRAVAEGYFATKSARELTLYCPKRPRGSSGIRVNWEAKAGRSRSNDPLASDSSFSVSWEIEKRKASPFPLDIVLALAERGIPSSCPMCGAEGKGKAVGHQMNGCPPPPRTPSATAPRCQACGEHYSASGHCGCPDLLPPRRRTFCVCGDPARPGDRYCSDGCRAWDERKAG